MILLKISFSTLAAVLIRAAYVLRSHLLFGGGNNHYKGVPGCPSDGGKT